MKCCSVPGQAKRSNAFTNVHHCRKMVPYAGVPVPGSIVRLGDLSFQRLNSDPLLGDIDLDLVAQCCWVE